MILASNSTFCQYPIIKKIGNDSLILMTIKQGDDINAKFALNRARLDSLKDSIKVHKYLVDSLKIKYDSLNNQLIPMVKQYDEYKFKYEERLKMPTTYKYHDDGWDFAQKMVLMAVIVLQFFTIPRK